MKTEEEIKEGLKMTKEGLVKMAKEVSDHIDNGDWKSACEQSMLLNANLGAISVIQFILE